MALDFGKPWVLIGAKIMFSSRYGTKADSKVEIEGACQALSGRTFILSSRSGIAAVHLYPREVVTISRASRHFNLYIDPAPLSFG